MKKSSKILILILVVLLILAVALSFLMWNNTKEASLLIPGADQTVFPVSCINPDATNINNCKNVSALPRIAYKVNPSSSTVVEWYPTAIEDSILISKGKWTPATSSDSSASIKYWNHQDCTIVDKNNWSCVSEPATPISPTFGFNQGKYFDNTPLFFSGSIIYVSPNEWEQVINEK